MSDEPVVAYPVREVLARMESKLDSVVSDVHKLQLGQAAEAAVARARAAMWTAGVSALAAVSALLVVVLHR